MNLASKCDILSPLTLSKSRFELVTDAQRGDPGWKPFPWCMDWNRYRTMGGRIIYGEALHPGVTRNFDEYIRREVELSARMLIGKPLEIDRHGNLMEAENVVLDAEPVGGNIQYIARVLDKDTVSRIDNGDIRWVSFNGICRRTPPFIPGAEPRPCEGLLLFRLCLVGETSPLPPGDPQTSVHVWATLSEEIVRARMGGVTQSVFVSELRVATSEELRTSGYMRFNAIVQSVFEHEVRMAYFFMDEEGQLRYVPETEEEKHEYSQRSKYARDTAQHFKPQFRKEIESRLRKYKSRDLARVQIRDAPDDEFRMIFDMSEQFCQGGGWYERNTKMVYLNGFSPLGSPAKHEMGITTLEHELAHSIFYEESLDYHRQWRADPTFTKKVYDSPKYKEWHTQFMASILHLDRISSYASANPREAFAESLAFMKNRPATTRNLMKRHPNTLKPWFEKIMEETGYNLRKVKED